MSQIGMKESIFLKCDVARQVANTQGGAKVGLQLWVHETEFDLVLLFINYCIFHMNNYKPPFAHLVFLP